MVFVVVVVRFPVAARIARALELTFIVAARWMLAGFMLVRRNASYVYEIDYCAIGAGSQKICRNMVNTLS